jgi:HEAT repeat protein
MLDDPSPFVRESAVRIAGYFGYTECRDAVFARVEDSDEAVAAAALEHLPYFDDEGALEVLGAALASGTARTRSAAAHALGAIPGQASQKLLQLAVADAEPWVRYFAAISLGRLGDPRALTTLERLVQSDPAPQVGVAAIEAVGAIGGESAVQILGPLAADPTDRGHTAVRVLGQVSAPGALEALQAALRSPDSLRRQIAVEALASFRTLSAVETLRWTASGDADPVVARESLAGLAAISTQSAPVGRAAVQAIVACLNEPARRADALTTLSRLQPAAIPWLAEALEADDPATRRGVVEALGRISHPAASASLRMALSDGDAVVRRHAVAALSRIGTRGLAKVLSKLAQHDPAPPVRQAAAVALHRQTDQGYAGDA